MYETLHCIALRTVQISDSRSILSAWSVERGFVSFALSAGKSRSALRQKALTMPLSAFEGVCDVRPGRDVLFVRDLRPMGASVGVADHPARLAVALFLAEVYQRLLRESERDDAVSQTIFDTVEALSSAEGVAIANHPLWALYRLTLPLGIAPDMSQWTDGALFDMDAARWTMTMTGTSLATPEESAGVKILSRMNRRNLGRIRLTRDSRRRMLDGLIRYYDMHFYRLSPLNSLDVVRELF